MRYPMRQGALLMPVLLTVACATTSGVRSSQGDGESRVYRATYDELWAACFLALAENGLPIVEADKHAGIILASKDVSFFSYGERVGVFVNANLVDTTTLAVEVVSKRVLATNITAKNWTESVFSMLEAHLPPSAVVYSDLTNEMRRSARLTLDDLAECQGEVESGRERLHVTESELRRCRKLNDNDEVQACLVDASAKQYESRAFTELNACLADRRDKGS